MEGSQKKELIVGAWRSNQGRLSKKELILGAWRSNCAGQTAPRGAFQRLDYYEILSCSEQSIIYLTTLPYTSPYLCSKPFISTTPHLFPFSKYPHHVVWRTFMFLGYLRLKMAKCLAPFRLCLDDALTPSILWRSYYWIHCSQSCHTLHLVNSNQ